MPVVGELQRFLLAGYSYTTVWKDGQSEASCCMHWVLFCWPEQVFAQRISNTPTGALRHRKFWGIELGRNAYACLARDSGTTHSRPNNIILKVAPAKCSSLAHVLDHDGLRRSHFTCLCPFLRLFLQPCLLWASVLRCCSEGFRTRRDYYNIHTST